MSEILPRFGLNDISFIETDAQTIEDEIIGTYEKITGRTLAKADPVRLFLLSLAAVIIQQRQAFNLAAKQGLLTYAQGEFLDHLGEFVNTPRLRATGASVTLRFTLSQAQSSVYIIPKGTRVSDSRMIFATDEVALIPVGELMLDVTATCVTAGTDGNGIPTGEISQLNDPLPFMQSVENITVSEGGSDTEDDASYAERIRLAPASFSVAGPHDSYVYHALAANALICDVSVYGVATQPGYVYVHPLLDGGELPGEPVLEDVRARLNDETVRPITDCVVVSAPEAVNYTIELTWYLSEDDLGKIASVTSAVASAVEDYRLWQQNRIGRDINPDRLVELVRGAGAKRMMVTAPVYTKVTHSQVAQCAPSAVRITFGGTEEA